MRRFAKVLLIVAVVALLIAGGWAARGVIRTPAEATLPEPTPIAMFVDVTSGPIAATMSGSGVITSSESTAVTSINSEAGRIVVSDNPVSVGDELPFCSAIIEISGRPVVALPGGVVAYRDIGLGDSGDDVEQLQAGLESCGYEVEPDGKFGARTAAAVRALYVTAGYEPPTRPGAEVESATDGDDPGAGTGADGSTEATEPPPPRPEVYVPFDEIAYFSSGGVVAQVAAINSLVGTDPVVTIDHGALVFRVELSGAARVALTPDAVMTIGIDPPVEATVPDPPAAPSTNEAGEPVFPVSIPLGDDTDVTLAGTTASYSIVVSDGVTYEAVVPVTALYDTATGETYVRVRSQSGEPTSVPVTVVASAGGLAAVEGAVDAGDAVQVGWQ